MTRMKCWLAVLAVAALAWALPVRAQRVAEDGQGRSGAGAGAGLGQKISTTSALGGNMDPTDSTQAADRGTKTQGKWTYTTNPLNGNTRWVPAVYWDTLSLNGRKLDSLATAIDVSDLKTVTLHFKMEGHHGAVAGVMRMAVQVYLMAGATPDTISTWSGGAHPGENPVTAAALDSVGVLGGEPAAGVPWAYEFKVVLLNAPTTVATAGGHSIPVRTASKTIFTGGAKYLWLKFRVLSDTGTSATQGYAFRLRVDYEGSSL